MISRSGSRLTCNAGSATSVLTIVTFGPDGTLYASELGWNDWDELNVVQAGANYGWPMSEGPDGELGVPPIYALRPSEASPSG